MKCMCLYVCTIMSVNGTGDDGYQEKKSDAEIIITKLNSLEFNFEFIPWACMRVCLCVVLSVCEYSLDINVYWTAANPVERSEMQEHTLSMWSIIIVSFLPFLCAFDRKYPSNDLLIYQSIERFVYAHCTHSLISTHYNFVVALIYSYFIIPLCDRVYPSIHPSIYACHIPWSHCHVLYLFFVRFVLLFLFIVGVLSLVVVCVDVFKVFIWNYSVLCTWCIP